MAHSLKKNSSGEKSLPSIGLPKKASMIVFVVTILLAAALLEGRLNQAAEPGPVMGKDQDT